MWEDFEMKNKGDYHDFTVQRNKYLVADLFLRFQDICLKIYEFNPCPFFTASGLTWQVLSKRQKQSTARTIDWNWYDVNGRKKHMAYVMVFIGKWKLIANTGTIIIKIKNRQILIILMQLNCMDEQCFRITSRSFWVGWKIVSI